MSEDSDSQVCNLSYTQCIVSYDLSFLSVLYLIMISSSIHKTYFQIEEDCPTFRPFTRESLAKIEARIEEVNEKKRELEKKRAEGEVNI